MDKLVEALGPAFAAGFAVQQLLELLDPIMDKIKVDKKLVLGIVSSAIGLVLALGAGLRVLEPLGVVSAGYWDVIITALIISAGTEGFNSVIKFLGYTKDRRRKAAGTK
jgi:uncharacterized membrane protein